MELNQNTYVPIDDNTMHYQPQTNDYVKYNTLVGNHLEGWIYWIDPEKRYLTLEIMVREKSEESYKDCVLHRNERCLVCVYPEDWNRLEYVRTRRSPHQLVTPELLHHSV